MIEEIRKQDSPFSYCGDLSLQIPINSPTTINNLSFRKFKYITYLSILTVILGLLMTASFVYIKNPFNKSHCDRTLICSRNLYWVLPFLMIAIGINGLTFNLISLDEKSFKFVGKIIRIS